jgi:hypothetical protein
MSVPRRWAPNPYAIAQLMSPSSDFESLFKADGKDADAFIKKVLTSRRDLTVASVFKQFNSMVDKIDEPVALDDALGIAEKEALPFTAEQLRAALPYVLPISDRGFEALGIRNIPFFEANAGDLMIDDATCPDPVQGAVGNCYLVASMIALAWTHPSLLKSRLNASGFVPNVQPSFTWTFHNDEGDAQDPITVTSRIPMAGQIPRYARSLSQLESWPSLLEKAYVAKVRNLPNSKDPAPLDYQLTARKTSPPQACQALFGGRIVGEVLASDLVQQTLFKPAPARQPASERHLGPGVVKHPVTAWTMDDIGQLDPEVWEHTGLWPAHAYAVLGTMPSGHIVLRNPYGIPTSVHEGYSTEEIWEPPDREPIELNRNGVFAITEQLFFKNFRSIGWLKDLPDS